LASVAYFWAFDVRPERRGSTDVFVGLSVDLEFDVFACFFLDPFFPCGGFTGTIGRTARDGAGPELDGKELGNTGVTVVNSKSGSIASMGVVRWAGSKWPLLALVVA
jgi:hypothetical protein